MKKLAMWSLILAVAVLAVGTAAQAAVVDITLTFDKTTGIAIGEVVNWQITAQVSQNTYVWTPVAGGATRTVAAGLQALAVGITSTANVGRIQEEWDPFGGPEGTGAYTGRPDPAIYNSAAVPAGFGEPSLGWNPAYSANNGIIPQLLNLPTKNGHYASGDYASTTSLKDAYKLGVVPIVYASGTWTATAGGTTELDPYSVLKADNLWNISVFTVDTTGDATHRGGLSQRNIGPATDTLNTSGVTLVVVGGEPENTAPTVSIPGGDVGEADWSKEPGWNNPLHSVMITADGQDDGNPIPPGALTYEWTMSKPGGGSKLLAETGKVLTLTIAEIASLGLPGPYNTPPGPDPDVYMWDLSVKAYDGELYSPLDGIKVFVPEPATIGLLSFGVAGALLRRRRRA